MTTATWRDRITSAYGNDARMQCGKSRVTIGTRHGRVVHLPEDDGSVEIEKLHLGRMLLRRDDVPHDGGGCRQHLLMRLFAHHGVDAGTAMPEVCGRRPVIHDRGDLLPAHVNVLGRHEAIRPERSAMGDMPSYVIENWDPFPVMILLNRDVIIRIRGMKKGQGHDVTISLLDGVLPRTICDVIVGRPAHEVVRHDAFIGSGYLITGVTPNRRTTTLRLTSVPDGSFGS